jgi:hypothetical protein
MLTRFHNIDDLRQMVLSSGSTREGHAAIGYIGNVALVSFPAPAPKVLQRLEKALSELPSYSRKSLRSIAGSKHDIDAHQSDSRDLTWGTL